jgi:hypothetical protein
MLLATAKWQALTNPGSVPDLDTFTRMIAYVLRSLIELTARDGIPLQELRGHRLRIAATAVSTKHRHHQELTH